MKRAARPRGRTLAGCGIALSLIASLAGCGSLYKVKPTVDAPATASTRTGEAGGVRLRAVPLLTDEESQELFESNLPLGGLLPVRVEIMNGSGAMIELKRARFRLRDGAGTEWKYRSARQAVSRILDADDITIYNPQSRARFEEDFTAHALNVETPLAPGERRQGLIFFQMPKKMAIESPAGLVLTIEKLPQPLEIRLN